MRSWLFFFISLIGPLLAKDGIIVAVCDKYMKDFYPALAWLRFQQKCNLPIEVWYSGDELSPYAKECLKRFGQIEFRDIAEVLGGEPEEYRGYQIKPLILQQTQFDRVILMDADIYLYIDPKELFDLPEFIETGAFFFRDTDNRWYVSPYSVKHPRGYTYEKFERRRKFLLEHIQSPSQYMPPDWRFFWSAFEPSDDYPQLGEFMESGLVIIDKNRHKKGIEEIVKLNLDWRRVYAIFLGDKDTFWIGMEIAGEPYSINSKIPYRLYGGLKLFRDSNRKVDLVHHVHEKLVFQQKSPIEIGLYPYYTGRWVDSEKIEVPKEELEIFSALRYFFKRFNYKPEGK